MYTEYTSWCVPEHFFFSWAHTAHSVAQDKIVSASFIVIPHAHSQFRHAQEVGGLPSSAPASHLRESGRPPDSAPGTGYEPNLADFSKHVNTEHNPIDIPENNPDFRCSDGVTLISSSARGMQNSEALSSSHKAAASKVSFFVRSY